MARFITGAGSWPVRWRERPGCLLQFLGWNILGALVWCTLVVTVGYLLGDEFYRAASMTHQNGAMDWARGIHPRSRRFVLLVERPKSVARPEP